MDREPPDTEPYGAHAPTDRQPFVAPWRALSPLAPLRWLRAGWDDYRAAPAISLTWGVFLTLVSALIAWAAWMLGGVLLLFAVASGYVFVAPVFAFALYSISRQLHDGHRPELIRTLRAMRKPFGNALIFALILLVVFLVWARAGTMVHVFFPAVGQPGLADVVRFLAVGSAVGAVFAGFTFSCSAYSLPFMANREVDVVTAVISSINAVLRNWEASVVWAVLIALLTVIGFATAMLGFIVIGPLLGYATWHGYHEALAIEEWPTLPQIVPWEEAA